MLFENIISKVFTKIAYSRYDDLGTAYYFDVSDFKNLQKDPYSFNSSNGHKLQGYYYYYENYNNKRIIVFDHGFGAGHRAYMREIEMLCKAGYKVFSYDHTGCMESGGRSANGLSQSLCDLNDCINAIKANEQNINSSISVVGHSWGAFSTLNILTLHPDITHIVAISGYVSIEKLIGSLFFGILKPWKKALLQLEEKSNTVYYHYNALNSLQFTNRKVLCIYSDNDMICTKDPHYNILFNTFKDKPNFRFMLEHKKGHNPNYTADAVKYLSRFTKQRNRFIKSNPTNEQKEKFIQSFDWYRMTNQDENVWKLIYEHLEN